MTPTRTKKVVSLIEKNGGKVNSMYSLIGIYDLAFIVDFPGISEVMKVSVDLTKSTGISFTTFPAITVEEFDKLVG
ncbi:MAG: GYD domain-containing protein [Nitrospirae bacterium]|nr:GYD domain-containing protein [Nitrospirota bacterium]